MNPAWWILIAFLCLAAMGQPLFVMLGVVSLLGFNLAILASDAPQWQQLIDNSTNVIGEIHFGLTKSDVLISIPLFTLAGTIMTHGGISPRLIAIARALAGWLPGGLAITCVLACTFFAAISGSSSVTIIAIGGILYPALRKEGYSEKFALGLITICGAIGTLIPPSLPLIVYGVIAGNSVADNKLKPAINDLFIAGIGPSILSVIVLCGYCMIVGMISKVPRLKFSGPELLVTVKRGFFALLMPVILLGLIYGGFSTVAEASAVAVVYALFVECVMHRALSVRQLFPIMKETITLVGAILIILVMALALTNWLTDDKIPDKATDLLRFDRVEDKEYFEVLAGEIVKDVPGEPLEILLTKENSEEPERRVIARENVGWTARKNVETKMGFLIGANILLLIVGCIMDIFSGIIVLAPLLVPMAVAYDVNLVHLGIIFTFNLELGFVTPPFGINLFISQSFFRKPMNAVVGASLPYIGILLMVLAVVTYFPSISLWLLGPK